MRKLVIALVIGASTAGVALPALADSPVGACVGQVTLSVAGTTVIDQHDICTPSTP